MRKTTSALALVLITMACARGDRAAVDSSGGTAGLVSQSVAAAPARGADLAKPVDQYTGEEFYSHVRGLTYVGGIERERGCRGCTGARAAVRTRVRVDGVDGVDSIGAANVPAFGVVVARGQNRGGDPESRYGMRPGERFEYYLIVMPGTGGGAPTWRIEELEITGNRYARRQLAVGRIVECNHPFERGARSDFRSCASSSAANPAMFGSLQAGAGDDPWWYGCALGCCVAERGGDA